MAARDEVKRLAEELKGQRDELALRVHLARREVRDEWTALEKTWDHFRGRVEVIGREVGDAAEDVGSALRLVASELKRGYERVRRLV